MALSLLDELGETVSVVSQMPEEIQWDMLASQAFITSVQTTTGEVFIRI